MELYNNTCIACSRLVTQAYSTSFALGIKTLSPAMRGPIYSIYGFVRFADEIVDTFFAHPQENLLAEFEADTWRAIERGISLNPVLQAFQGVVRQYNIDHELIEAFIQSMKMDLLPHLYERNAYEKYIYGSAEVVGLMCLKVFCNGDELLYKQLEEPARKLGAAFQKVNLKKEAVHTSRELIYNISAIAKKHK
jgi:15-cis-phytoene synthase